MSKKKLPEPEKLRLVRLELSEKSHACLRVIAAQHGVPMSRFVRDTIEEIIQKESKKNS